MDNLRSAKDRCFQLWHQKKNRLEQNLQLRLFEQDCDRVRRNLINDLIQSFSISYVHGLQIVVQFLDLNILKLVRVVQKQCNY